MMKREITGRMFAIIFASFFVVIIGVNLFLAYSAVSTFPGLETDNSYVASQQFDTDRAAQQALGWTVDAHVEAGILVVTVTDKLGARAKVKDLSGTFGRATSVKDDQSPQFSFDGKSYRAEVTYNPGNWNFRMTARAQDGTPFRQRIVIKTDHAHG